ncbi:ABC transporter permease [Luteimicrobium xylanilyticum]|uniref:Methionine import system permease protein MetP n=1 Tax=Luteimicrobium xylanilyticum TaxID=1133546 RepID=A0A5P9QHG3_9MICO|nr:methionine ABC transporter permease [Luteimicrobium xylanilyticum]QFU99905.1 Methionine import system permease protein MetP [Luteimicrobium xylanilyticum]
MIVHATNEWTWDYDGPLLRQAIGETLQMVLAALVIGGIIGLVYGLALYSTRRGGLYQSRWAYGVLSFVVNLIRPIPFIIFLTAVRPATLAITGTTLGVQAAIFPMTVVTIVATARLVEQNLVSADPGVIEAARAMGASKVNALVRVLVPEALAPLILGYAFLFVGILDMSAVAGAVGAGGLGNFAIQYGYNRYNDVVTWVAVAVIIVLVQLAQMLGNTLARRVLHR